MVIVNQLGPEFGQTLRDQFPSLHVIEHLRDTPYWAIDPRATALFTAPHSSWESAPSERPECFTNVSWFQTLSAGIDYFPSWVLELQTVTHGRGLTAGPIAEYVFAAMLARTKRLHELRVQDPTGWRRPKELGGLEGRTLGLAGYGAIGQSVATRALAFGMRVLALRRRSSTDAVAPAGVRFVEDIRHLFQQSDHLVLALPLTAATRHIVSQAVLEQARAGLHLINVARGALVDDSALLASLESGQVGFATLDVTYPEPLPAGHPFYQHPRIQLTPHTAYADSAIDWTGAQQLVAENTRRFLGGRPLINAFDPVAGY